MKLQLIRNATLKLSYAGSTLLVDPWFADADDGDPTAPRTPLPLDIDEVLEDVDLHIVTGAAYGHVDFDERGKVGALLRKDLPLLCRRDDYAIFGISAFENVRALDAIEGALVLGGLSARAVPAGAGSMGVVLEAEGDPTVYLVGSTPLNDAVAETVRAWAPEVIVTCASGAAVPGYGRLAMDADDIVRLAASAPDATIVAVGLDALAQASVTRAGLRSALAGAGAAGQVLVPADGETLALYGPRK